MTIVEGPAPTQAPALFGTSIFECQRLGMKIPEENIPLITSPLGIAMVPVQLEDPLYAPDHFEPAKDLEGKTILLPGVIHYRSWLSTSPRFTSLEALDKYEPGWRRFPSLIGSLETPLLQYLGGDPGDEAIYRLWDVTPITQPESQIIINAGVNALEHGRWYELFEWGSIDMGYQDDGGYEDSEGEMHTLEEVFEGMSRDLFECQGEFPTDFYGNNQPMPTIGKPLPGVGEYPIHLPAPLDLRWRRLLARSKISWSVCQRVLSPDDYRVKDREMRFNPWG